MFSSVPHRVLVLGAKNTSQPILLLLLTPNLTSLSALRFDEASQDVKAIPVRLQVNVIWLAVSLCLSGPNAGRSQQPMVKRYANQPDLSWRGNSCEGDKLIAM